MSSLPNSGFQRPAFRACLLWTVLALITVGNIQALDTLYLFRHADKVKFWPKDRALNALRPLSQAGAERADRLVERLADESIVAIYTSVTTRTLATGMPLAEATGVPIHPDRRTIKPAKMGAFFKQLRKKHQGDEAVLIVGHSNTIPELLMALGATESCFAKLGIGIGDADDELLIEGYEGLWRVDLSRPGCDGIERQTFAPDDGDE